MSTKYEALFLPQLWAETVVYKRQHIGRHGLSQRNARPLRLGRFPCGYHAGPWRYEQHLVTGKPLPSETTAYVAAVTPLLDNEQGEHAAVDGRRALPWREAPLFVERAGAP